MSTTMPNYAKTSLLGLIGYGLHSAYSALTGSSRSLRGAREASQMSTLSDFELARLGMTRDQLSRRAGTPPRRI